MGSYSRRRFSSRLIFLLKPFIFMMRAPAYGQGESTHRKDLFANEGACPSSNLTAHMLV